MRMEELSDSRYIKGTDTVERYLLNLVQEYFKNSNIASTTSREYIIKKAVERMKEEITFDNIGVLSITLPNGEERTGAVTITLEDLNGEPLISPKLSAFNVDFGTEQNTACEGNDSRLSDARKPLSHNHEISDIVGLEGMISSLTGKIERVDGFLHEHNNKNVLDMLVYTGNNSTIDLTGLESLEDKIVEIIDEIRQEIIDYKQEINDKITEINQKTTDVKSQIDILKQYILDTNKEYYDLSKQYTDDSITKAQQEVNTELDNLITRDMFDEALEVARNTYTFVGSMEFDLDDKLDFNNGTNNQSITIDIDTDIIAELTERDQSLENCQIETFIQYKESSTSKVVYGALPYIIFNDNVVDGSIQLSTIYTDSQLLLSFNSASLNITDEIKDARIIYNVYAKEKVTLV